MRKSKRLINWLFVANQEEENIYKVDGGENNGKQEKYELYLWETVQVE